MKRNILFIDPQGGCSMRVNIGLGYIASSLKNNKNCNFRILDFNLIKEPYEKILKEIANSQTIDGVGVTINIGSMHAIPDLLKKIKMYFPKARVFIGGPHVTLLYKKLFAAFPGYFDFAVVGETENTISSIIENLHLKDELASLPGVVLKDDLDKVHQGDMVANLDELDFPAYERFESVRRNNNAMGYYQILTSRGCPYNCTYCAGPKISGKKWRYRSPENVVAEIEFAFKKHQTNNLEIIDDNFPLKEDRMMTILDTILKKDIKMRFRFANGIRADKLNEGNVKVMKKAGLFEVSLGIETADPDLFLSLKKGETFDKIERAVEVLQKFDIKIGGSFIVGLPGATLERDMKSIKFANKSGFSWRQMAWFYFIPYPFTEAHDIFRKEIHNEEVIDQSYQRSAFTAQQIETENYPLEERIIVRSIASRIPPIHPGFGKWRLLKLFLKMELTILKHRDKNLGFIRFHMDMTNRIMRFLKLWLTGQVHPKAYL
ncbi:MAG: radical SAM protein [Candidatus Ratteibacteria bacterium]|nr:radical SAM protein [Candidatus Ratteibacteria bacterium]